MNIADVIRHCTKPTSSVDPDAPTGDVSRPWWVVVVNPRRQPPQPKFHTGHVSRESAERTCAERQKAADKDAATKSLAKKMTVEPFLYFVIERPEGGNL